MPAPWWLAKDRGAGQDPGWQQARLAVGPLAADKRSGQCGLAGILLQKDCEFFYLIDVSAGVVLLLG